MAQVRALGASALQIIADFDMTLTRFHLANGARGLTSHRVVGGVVSA